MDADSDAALVDLLEALGRKNYQFVTPLNATYRIVRGRPRKQVAQDVRDVLGWSLPFRPGSIDREIEALLDRAGCLADTDGGVKATVRVSTVWSRRFLHSAYPADDEDAVFLGPDSYRFAEFLRVELAQSGLRDTRIVDVGAGAGVGGVLAASFVEAPRVILNDVNPTALRLAAINAAHAGIPLETSLGSGLTQLDGPFDLVISNPPFIARGGKTYNQGGGDLGTGLSLQWARQAFPRLSPGGRLLMYTGAPIVAGEDALRSSLEAAAREQGLHLSYRELDPDIFGSELRRPVYADVERIAAVGVAVTRPPAA